MELVNPEELFESGRAHALTAAFLHEKSIEFAKVNGIEDAKQFAFNGTFSLSLHYLVGLGFELLLKSAYVKMGGDPNPAHLRNSIGHDLVKALDHAKGVGFNPDAKDLAEIVGYLSEPYKQHLFRYARPAEIALPNEKAIFGAFESLDQQLCLLFGWETYQP